MFLLVNASNVAKPLLPAAPIIKIVSVVMVLLL
jgi:hypothetical protein